MHPSRSESLMQDPNASVSSHLDSAFGTLSRNVATASLSPHVLSNDMDPGLLVNSPYLASDIPLHDGSYMHRNNFNMESYLDLPMLSSHPVTNSSPRVTSSPGVDHLLVPDQSLEAVQSRAQEQKRRQNQLSILGSMSQSRLQSNQFALPSLMNYDDSAQVLKRPGLESNKDDLLIRYMIQQLLMFDSPKQLPSHDLKLVPLDREYQFPNSLQKETVQFPSKSIEGHCHQSVTHQKQLPEPIVSPVPITSGNIYADRLMEYLHHHRYRPKQNSMAYWKKFVLEFYDSNSKRRWCLSKYDHEGCHKRSAFSRSAVDHWNCDLCGTDSGRGFEAKFEVLPRLCKGYFDNGVLEELLYFDFPCESKLPSGCMMLQYRKAVQETVYKHSRVVHEGQLRVTFTKDLKIISWEFCSQHHEEFVLRRSIAPQVKQLIQVSQKCKDNIDRNKYESNLRHSNFIQATHNRFVKAGQQLEKILDSHINESGLPKQLERFLRVAEVMDCMKDLITFSHENKLSPIESLNKYAAHTKFKANQMNEPSLQQNIRGLQSMPFKSGAEEAWDSYQNLVNQDPRKYVLNKQLVQNMFDSGSTQDSQVPMSSQTVKASGVKGRNGRKTNGQRTPRRGSGFRGCAKKGMEELEDGGVPMLPGVQVKEEVLFGEE